MYWTQFIIFILLVPYVVVAVLWFLMWWIKARSPELFVEPEAIDPSVCTNCGYDEFQNLRHGRIQCKHCGWLQRTEKRVINVE